MSKLNIVLSSNSPRRKELLSGLGLDFRVHVIGGIDESYPHDLPASDVPQYIAKKKAAAYDIADDEIVITADTLVIVGNEILGKPHDANDARRMLHTISGRKHQVTTGVCITSKDRQSAFSVTTDVAFRTLTDEEIDFYVANYKPLDKAGAYGIQEWIGYIGVESIHGSYFNVMGLPVQRIYSELVGKFGLSLDDLTKSV